MAGLGIYEKGEPQLNVVDAAFGRQKDNEGYEWWIKRLGKFAESWGFFFYD